MHFGTERAGRNASLDKLQKTPSVSVAMAQVGYDFFHSS